MSNLLRDRYFAILRGGGKMNWRIFALGLALSAAGATQALASSTVFVSAFAGPWDNSANPTMVYGVGDNASPVVLALGGATSITISYVDGLVSAFGGVAPTVDALGYVGSAFGSGVGLSGIGSSGTPFPSFFIDPNNTGPNIFLAALIGTFTNSSGVIVGTPFAPGDGPFVVAVPSGASFLSLGVNDDIFSDNSGGWDINVAGIGAATPEPSTWAMMLLGLGGLGLARYRASRKAAVA
jgi:PEP-CTERM motif